MPSFEAFQKLALLLGAESEKVREAVAGELASYGDVLEDYIQQAHDQLDPEVLFHLHEILREARSSSLRDGWLDWLSLKNDYLKLEHALSFLAENQREADGYPPLPEMLDGLAREFLLSGAETNIFALNEFLFTSGRYKGAREDYYHPLHSNLCYVMQEGQGLPISLACLMMLVAYRLGLEARGFNLPGHFLVRITEEGRPVLIDVFNKGKRLHESELTALSLSPKINYSQLVNSPPTAEDIITRILVNLIKAYHRAGQMEEHYMAQDLLADLRNRLNGDYYDPDKYKKASRYKPGQLVKHRSYGYRGVVVDYDERCMADEEWYRNNRSQPDKEQPWYHILVDGSNVTTYAAQTSLEKDSSGSEIHHPLVPLYFQGFKDGNYHRNSVPWSLGS